MEYDDDHGSIDGEISLFGGHPPMLKMAMALKKQKWIKRLAFQHSLFNLYVQVMDWDGGGGPANGHFLIIYNDGPTFSEDQMPKLYWDGAHDNSYDFYDFVHDTSEHGLTRESVIKRIDKTIEDYDQKRKLEQWNKGLK